MAESLLRHHVALLGLEENFVIDSAGTGDGHEGEPADPRTVATLARHGIPCKSIARQLKSRDFTDFDWLFAMDSSNLRDIRAWTGANPTKVRLFLSHDVPDPYYGPGDGFQRVFDMLDKGCQDFLATLEHEDL